MKKLIAIFLVCLMVASMVACGKKKSDPNGTQPQNGSSSQAGSADTTVPSQDDETDMNAGASAESTAPSEEPTEPTQDPNKIEPSPTTPNKGETDKDEDITVDFDENVGEDTPVVTPPSDNANSNFVIDFDDLLEASKN